jgi:hypothetical protein
MLYSPHVYPVIVRVRPDPLDKDDQRLGINEVDEGIWLVSFISYGLGFIERTSP